MESDPRGASACLSQPDALHLAAIGPLLAKSLPGLASPGLALHPGHTSLSDHQQQQQQQQQQGGDCAVQHPIAQTQAQGPEAGQQGAPQQCSFAHSPLSRPQVLPAWGEQQRGQDPLAGVGQSRGPGGSPRLGSLGRAAQGGEDRVLEVARAFGRSRSYSRHDFAGAPQQGVPEQQASGTPPSSSLLRSVLNNTCSTSPLKRATSISQPVRGMRGPPGLQQNQQAAESQAQPQQDGPGSMAHNLQVLKAYLASQQESTPVVRSGPAAQRLNQDGTVSLESGTPREQPSAAQELLVEVAPGDLERTSRVGRSCPVLPSQGLSSQRSSLPIFSVPGEFEAKILEEVEAALAAKEPPKEVFRKDGPWNEEEDQELLRFVEHFGARHWRKVPTKTRLRRDPQSCRLRWTTHLSLEASKQPFSPEEDKLLLESVSWSGETKWTTIAAHKFPKRTGYQIHKRWMYLMEQQRKARGEASGMEHEPVDMDQAIKEAAATAALAAAAAAKARQAEGKISGKVLERVGAVPGVSAPLSPAARTSLVSNQLSLPLRSSEAVSQRAGLNLALLGSPVVSSNAAAPGRPGFSAPVSGAGLLHQSPLAQALLQSIAMSAQTLPQPVPPKAASPVRYTAGAPSTTSSPGQHLQQGVEDQGWRASGEGLGHTRGAGSMSGIDLNSSGMEEETRCADGPVFGAGQGSKGFDLNQGESPSPEVAAHPSTRVPGSGANLDLNSVDPPADVENEDLPSSRHFFGIAPAVVRRSSLAAESPRGSQGLSQGGRGTLSQFSGSPNPGQKRSADSLLPLSSDSALLPHPDVARRQKLEDRDLQVPGGTCSPVLISSHSVSSARLEGVGPSGARLDGVGLSCAGIEGMGRSGIRVSPRSEHLGRDSGEHARMDLNLNLTAPEQDRADPAMPAVMPGSVAPLSLVSLLPNPAAAGLGADELDGAERLEPGTSQDALPEPNSLLAVYEAAIDQLAAQAKHKLHSMLGPAGTEKPAVSPGVSTSSCPQENSLGGAQAPSTASGSGPSQAGARSLPDVAFRNALGMRQDQLMTPRQNPQL